MRRTRASDVPGWRSPEVRDWNDEEDGEKAEHVSSTPGAGTAVRLDRRRFRRLRSSLDLDVRERPDRAQVGSWPPRIRARDVRAGFEGVRNRYGVFQTFIRTGHLERSLFVWFGRAHPTRRQLARANSELRTVS